MEGDKSINERKTKEFAGKKNTCMGDRSCSGSIHSYYSTDRKLCGRGEGNKGSGIQSSGKAADTEKRENIYLKTKGNSNRKNFKEGYL